MGHLTLNLLCIGVITAANAANSTLPDFDYNAWWGLDDQSDPNDTTIRPFKVSFDDEMITDLKDRLKRYRPSAPPLERIGFMNGFNTDHLESWIKYWAEEYNFSERAEYYNQYSHYLTKLQGLNIHFIWHKPCSQNTTNKYVFPLLILHGWGGSIREYYDAIRILSTDCDRREYVLELVVPSIPGFAFSDAAVRPGMGANEIGIVLRNLMCRLGYKKFGIHGGDWGSYIGASMATLFPDEVLGYHTNLPLTTTSKAAMMVAIGEFLPNLVVDSSLADLLYPLSDTLSWVIRESGYFHYQSTKPDTLGIAFSDSPVGLLAHIFQITSSITRKRNYYTEDGGLENTFTKEQLIDNLMLYWSNNKITTASRIYAETYNKKSFSMMVQEFPTKVPSWALQAPDEILYMSPVMLKTKIPNLLGVSVLNEGGHFLAFEQPEVFTKDLLEAIDAFIKWHTCNKSDDLD